jgi:hypothetical protein
MTKRAIAVTLVAVLVGAAVAILTLQASADHNSLGAHLLGENEVCSGGADCNDPNGRGRAMLTLNRKQRNVCFSIAWRRIGAPYAAHIHRGARGVEGPVVVTLFAATDLTRSVKRVSGCARASRALIDSIKSGPRSYYVNVHTPRYEGGAIRGQLH